jgi:hypothetical protein
VHIVLLSCADSCISNGTYNFAHLAGLTIVVSALRSYSVRTAVDKLRQQFFLAMIEGYANMHDWDAALKTVLEAFTYVSTALQKPLWQWRVITLSKKGKNVLDGIQKLKESDPSLQAQVFGILARASSNVQQQQESYQKAIEVSVITPYNSALFWFWLAIRLS